MVVHLIKIRSNFISMKKLALTVGILALPVVTFAQQLSNIQTLILSIGNIVNIVIPIVFAIALLVFFWGLVKFLLGGAEDKTQAKNLMIWGVVALFVMAAVWGLVRFIENAVGVNEQAAPSVTPLIPMP
jgi:hypothetical protein